MMKAKLVLTISFFICVKLGLGQGLVPNENFSKRNDGSWANPWIIGPEWKFEDRGFGDRTNVFPESGNTMDCSELASQIDCSDGYINHSCNSCDETISFNRNNVHGHMVPNHGDTYIGVKSYRDMDGPYTWRYRNNLMIGVKLNKGLKTCREYRLEYSIAAMQHSDKDHVAFDILLSQGRNSDGTPSGEQVEITGYGTGSVHKPNDVHDWQERSFKFAVQPDHSGGIEMNYLFFRVESGYAVPGESYRGIFLDRVQMYDLCKKECVSYSQSVFPSTDGNIDSESPLNINFLENYDFVEFSIKDNSGSLVEEYTYSNPPSTIKWDDIQISSAGYQIDIFAAGPCHHCGVTRSFTKYSDYSSPEELTPESMNTTIPKLKCCESEKDIQVKNQTLSENLVKIIDPIEYHAINRLEVGPNVDIPNGEEVTLKAGENVIINGPVSFEGEALISIQECAQFNKKGSNSGNNALSNNDSFKKVEKNVIKESSKHVKLLSNPVPKNSPIKIEFEKGYAKKVILEDTKLGVKLHNTLGQEVPFKVKGFSKNNKFLINPTKDIIGVHILTLFNEQKVLKRWKVVVE